MARQDPTGRSQQLKPLLWLLLPALGWGLWVVTGELTDWILNHSYPSTNHLQTQFFPTVKMTRRLTVTAIQAKVNQGDEMAEIVIEIDQSTLEKIELKFPLTDPAQIEAAISRELNIRPEIVRDLVYYRFYD